MSPKSFAPLRMTRRIPLLLSRQYISPGALCRCRKQTAPFHNHASYSSHIYQIFDSLLVLSHGRSLYSGPGSFAPVERFAEVAPGVVQPYTKGYNVADYLLEVASDPPLVLFQTQNRRSSDRTVNAILKGSEPRRVNLN